MVPPVSLYLIDSSIGTGIGKVVVVVAMASRDDILSFDLVAAGIMGGFTCMRWVVPESTPLAPS